MSIVAPENMTSELKQHTSLSNSRTRLVGGASQTSKAFSIVLLASGRAKNGSVDFLGAEGSSINNVERAFQAQAVRFDKSGILGGTKSVSYSRLSKSSLPNLPQIKENSTGLQTPDRVEAERLSGRLSELATKSIARSNAPINSKTSYHTSPTLGHDQLVNPNASKTNRVNLFENIENEPEKIDAGQNKIANEKLKLKNGRPIKHIVRVINESSNPLLVALHVLEKGLKLFARVSHLEHSERSELHNKTKQMLAAYGLHNVEIDIRDVSNFTQGMSKGEN